MSNFPGHSPYSAPGHQPPPQQFQQPPPAPPSSGGKIILIILGVIGVMMLFGCCVCGSLVYLGMSVEGDQLAESIRNDPTVISEIGEVESVSYNFNASGDHPDWDVSVYDVKGDKGTGTLYVTEPGMGIATYMELETANGTSEITFDVSKLEF